MKLTWWPTPQDYNEAIQVPQAYLEDPELKTGLVYTDALGLPRPVTGSFASVYRMHCQNKDYALRLFLRNIADQEERYWLISHFVQHDDLPYTVTFDFLKQGIKIRGEWLPALKMEWVEGKAFDDYIIENLANPDRLGSLCSKFISMMNALRAAGIAHGDLQHGNIIVWQDELRLVDYDGMFVPAMNGHNASELGHANYQHPSRAARHFGPYLDNFSAWVIYASMRALQIDSGLLHQLGGGDDCLLFRKSDFLDPINSAAFAAFEKHHNAELQILGRFIRAQLKNQIPSIPHLQLPVPAIVDSTLGEVLPEATAVRSGPRLIRGALPEWLDQSNLIPLASKDSDKFKPITAKASPTLVPPSETASSWTVVPQTRQQTGWVKPLAGQHLSQLNTPQLNSHAVSNLPSRPPPMLSRKRVVYNNDSGKTSPTVFQALMIFNPAVWAMCILIMTHAMIEAVVFLAIFNLLCEALIWLPAKSDRDLASLGVELLAYIDDLQTYKDKSGNDRYNAKLSYKYDGKLYTQKLLVLTHSEYHAMKKGSFEKILCDRMNPWHMVLFRSCRYQPATPAPKATMIGSASPISQASPPVPPVQQNSGMPPLLSKLPWYQTAMTTKAPPITHNKSGPNP